MLCSFLPSKSDPILSINLLPVTKVLWPSLCWFGFVFYVARIWNLSCCVPDFFFFGLRFNFTSLAMNKLSFLLFSWYDLLSVMGNSIVHCVMCVGICLGKRYGYYNFFFFCGWLGGNRKSFLGPIVWWCVMIELTTMLYDFNLLDLCSLYMFDHRSYGMFYGLGMDGML